MRTSNMSHDDASIARADHYPSTQRNGKHDELIEVFRNKVLEHMDYSCRCFDVEIETHPTTPCNIDNCVLEEKKGEQT